MLTEFQQTARRSSNKLCEKKSDDPAVQQSDDDRGPELDIEELKIGTIELDQYKNGQKKQLPDNNHLSASKNSYQALNPQTKCASANTSGTLKNFENDSVI